jgi:hypothetical protein
LFIEHVVSRFSLRIPSRRAHCGVAPVPNIRGHEQHRDAGKALPLTANSKALDDLLVTPLVVGFNVVEEPAAQAHHLEQSAT